jgi:long-chain acyl-CoA synthetase
MPVKPLFEYLYDQYRETPQERAYGHKVNDQWVFYSTREMVDMVNRISVGLLRLGLKPGDKVGTVVYRTLPEWVALDFAMLQIGVLNVPMYPTIAAREYEYILNEAEVQYCVVGDADLYDKINAAKPNVPGLKEIFSFYEHPNARKWDVLMAEPGCDLSEVERLKAAVQLDDVCTYIYTSGTTGNPKGVMLSHRNISYNVECMRDLIPYKPGDQLLSFLPVSHSFERAVVYAMTGYGLSVIFTGTDNLGGETGDLRTIRPNLFTTVPRLLEKVYDKIYAKGYELKGAKRAIFFWAMNLADTWDFDPKPGPWKALQWRIADKLVFSKWREALGGRVKGIITGANACPVKIMRVFNAAGIPVREGYGLTETAPAISFNHFAPGGAKLGTVGQPFEGTDILIDAHPEYGEGAGEILAKSPGVMAGYFKQPERTEEVIRIINGERWLATGDVGRLIEGADGRKFLKITDRKKELLKTSGGKYVAPAPIETLLKEHFLVEQAMIVGENRNYVCALIVPSEDGLREWCNRHEIPWTNVREAIQQPQVIERFQMLVERINPYFGKIEQIKKFTLLPDLWEPSKKDGSEAELTPTMKLKRRVIMDKFKREVDAMYAQ